MLAFHRSYFFLKALMLSGQKSCSLQQASVMLKYPKSSKFFALLPGPHHFVSATIRRERKYNEWKIRRQIINVVSFTRALTWNNCERGRLYSFLNLIVGLLVLNLPFLYGSVEKQAENEKNRRAENAHRGTAMKKKYLFFFFLGEAREKASFRRWSREHKNALFFHFIKIFAFFTTVLIWNREN